MAGIAKKFEGTKAVLFENVKGQQYPVLVGLYWNRDSTAKMFGSNSRELPFALAKEIGAWRQSPGEAELVDIDVNYILSGFLESTIKRF